MLYVSIRNEKQNTNTNTNKLGDVKQIILTVFLTGGGMSYKNNNNEYNIYSYSIKTTLANVLGRRAFIIILLNFFKTAYNYCLP